MDWVDASSSTLGRMDLTQDGRRQAAYLTAVRRGATESVPEPGAGQWQVEWASGTDLDPRLLFKLHVAPGGSSSIAAVAWAESEHSPWLAVSTYEVDDQGFLCYRLRLWDVLVGQSSLMQCDDPARCLVFTMQVGGPVLVSGHDSGQVRFWDVASSSLMGTVEVSSERLVDLFVWELDGSGILVSRDIEGRVRRLSLPGGAPLDAIGITEAQSMRGGQLKDGRHVLLFGGEEVTLWDVVSGTRVPARVPENLGQVGGAVLSSVDGRDCATVFDETRKIRTFDLTTGEEVSAPITAHVNARPDGLMRMWRDSSPRTHLAVVGTVLAVPTPWHVWLWDLATGKLACPPLSGVVAHSTVQAIRWKGRDLLLTASPYDGVVGIWDLETDAARSVGHLQHVVRISVAEPGGAVVSVDEGGTILSRSQRDDELVAEPLETGVESTCSLAAWMDGSQVFAATGAGSIYVANGEVRCWNVTGGSVLGSPLPAASMAVRWLAIVDFENESLLVTLAPNGKLKVWRPSDGELLASASVVAPGAVTGFAASIIDGRPKAVLSTARGSLLVYALDDLPAEPSLVAARADEVVLDAAGPYFISMRQKRAQMGGSTLRGWLFSGRPVGPAITSKSTITSVAVQSWPAVCLGRADGSVSLIDLESGDELCQPIYLPSRPNAMAALANGGIAIGFGGDVACVRPPQYVSSVFQRVKLAEQEIEG